MPLSPEQMARVKAIESALGSHRGWFDPHNYFDHHSGRVSLSQASGVWRMALELVNIAKTQAPQEPPAPTPKRWGDSTASSEEQYEDWLRICGHPVPPRDSEQFKSGLDGWLQMGMTRDPVG